MAALAAGSGGQLQLCAASVAEWLAASWPRSSSALAPRTRQIYDSPLLRRHGIHRPQRSSTVMKVVEGHPEAAESRDAARRGAAACRETPTARRHFHAISSTNSWLPQSGSCSHDVKRRVLPISKAAEAGGVAGGQHLSYSSGLDCVRRNISAELDSPPARVERPRRIAEQPIVLLIVHEKFLSHSHQLLDLEEDRAAACLQPAARPGME